MGVWKESGRKLVLGLIGCMAEREGKRMLGKYPQIDLLCGPGELDKLPLLLDNVMKTEVVRASVHYYNTEDEVDRVVAAIADLPAP